MNCFPLVNPAIKLEDIITAKRRNRNGVPSRRIGMYITQFSFHVPACFNMVSSRFLLFAHTIPIVYSVLYCDTLNIAKAIHIIYVRKEPLNQYDKRVWDT